MLEGREIVRTLKRGKKWDRRERKRRNGRERDREKDGVF